MSFLKAEWRKLALANYEVEPSLLQEYLPYGTELDLWKDKCYVSLVGFMFVNTKLLGMKIPFHVNFEEVNLRFYVRRKHGETWRRGVVFIKEIVPKPALSFVANTVYKENYEKLTMAHEWNEHDNSLEIKYRWKKKGQWQQLKVNADPVPSPIPAESDTEFITEHYWGYVKVTDSKTNEYEVTHPRWLAYKVNDYEIKVDFGVTYGEKFAFLTNQTPSSVMLAEGSAITVENKRSFSD